jgi:fibronectin-binding autotransporter adhesin
MMSYHSLGGYAKSARRSSIPKSINPMKNQINYLVTALKFAACTLTANTASAVSERFTSSGTFTPPAGITSVTVECWGGGGAGGAVHKTGTVTTSANNAIGGGGAGGAYAKRVNVPVTPGTPYTITIPAAATNSTLVVDTRVNGANVTFTGDDDGVGPVDDHICTAVGGEGGESAVSTNAGNVGLPGTGSTVGCVGDVFFAGGNGGTVGGGGGPSDLAAGINANSSSFAIGSDAIHNGGLGAATKTGAGIANNGGVPGAGGGGSRAATLGTSFAGGNGAKGQIIITYSGATVVKANNPDNLDQGSSWVGGNTPDFTGIAKWDATVTTVNTTVLGADLTWGGINIANPTGLVTINAGNTLTNNGGIDMSAATADLTLNCGLALGGPAIWNVAATRTLTVGGMVSGAQAITKQGDGKVILSSANTYSGETAVNGGSLQLGANDVIPDGTSNGNLSISASNTLDLNGYSDTINGLSGAGIVDNTAAATTSTLTAGGNNASSTFSGVIQNSGSTSVTNLVKTGSGTLTLSGANTFSGTVTVNGGRLALSNVSPLPNISGLTIGGAFLGVASVNNLVITAPITLTGNMVVIPNGGGVLLYSLNGPIGGTGNISFTTEANSYSGADNRASIGASGDFAGNITVSTQNPANNMTVQLGTVNALPATAVVTLDGGDGNGSTWSDLDLFGFNQTLAGLTNITRTSRLQRVYNADTNPTVTLTINNSSAYTFGGRLGKTGGTNFALTKSDIGTFTLTGINPFSGATKITAGILSLGNSQALQGSPLDTLNSVTGDATNGLQTTVTALTLGGLTGNKNLASVFETTAGGYSGVTALTLNPVTGASHSYSGGISAGAAGMTLTKSGAGTQTLSGSNTYTGATTVSAGTLSLVGGSQTSAITVDNLASLGFTLGSPTSSTAAVTFNAGSSVKITGAPAPATTYTLLTTTATITGPLTLNPLIPGFDLQVDGGNTLKLVPAAAAGYSSWAALNGAGPNLDDDHDNDGVDNGIEYFIGGPSGNTTGFTPLPSVNTASGLSVTWPKAATYTGSYGTDFAVETSATLTGPWTQEIEFPNSGYTVTFPTATEVKFTFPTPLGSKNFARIKVTGP